MKYLDLTGLETAIENIKTWALAQFSPAEIPHTVVMAAYNGTEGDELTEVFSSADFMAAYTAIAAGKTLTLPSATGYAVPLAVWTYTAGGSQIIGISMIDIFGGTELRDATFEFMRSGSLVTLSLRSIRNITTT